MSSICAEVVDLISFRQFTSDNKELLISIPHDKRKPSVKELDLLGIMLVEKALCIQWNIATGYFTFSIKLHRI